MESNLDTYLKKHLEEYITFMLSQGYTLSSIIKCLKKYGYKESMLREISPKDKSHYVRQHYDMGELDDDTKIFLRGIIKDYIHKMERHGYHKKEIRQALINYGHHPDIVDSAFKREKKYNIHTRKVVSFGSFLFYILIALVLILELEGTFPIAYLFFTPGLLGIAISILLSHKLKNYTAIINIIIVIVSFIGVVYLLTYYNIDFSSYDVDIILLINVLLSAFFSIMIGMSR